MGDPKHPKPTSLSLPPGCRFYPSEEQLLCYYLTQKNNDDCQFGFDDVINEIDLYNYSPFDLPDSICFRFGRGGRKRHWYCYVAARVLKKENGRRRAGGGYWKRSGQARDVMGGKVVAGTRKRFVFYLGDSLKKATRTEWVMYEYTLVDNRKDSFIVCRVFVKSCSRNNISDHVVSSYGEGSVATVRHAGIQHDGALTFRIGEGIVHDDNSFDKKNDVKTGSVGGTGTGSLSSLQVSPLRIQPDEPVTASGLITGASMFIGSFAAHHLISVLGEDFIELDDLACPLPDIDFT